jgi:hypothetical protein
VFYVYNIHEGDTVRVDTIKYMPSIEESCPIVIFSDSMLMEWNKASVKNIIRDDSIHMDDCLRFDIQFYKNKHQLRLEFSKKVLNNEYLLESDFDSGFYVIEEVFNGSYQSFHYYLIVYRRKNVHTTNKEIRAYHFAFSPHYDSFYLRNIATLDEIRFKKFYNSFIKQNGNDEMGLPYRKFNVTYFSRNKINSYITGCTGCIACIDEFKDMIK